MRQRASLKGVGSWIQPSPSGVWLHSRVPSSWLTHQYQGAGSPLAAALRESDSELAAQGSVIEAKKREVEAIRSRYEQDRQRYIALTDPRGSTSSPR